MIRQTTFKPLITLLMGLGTFAAATAHAAILTTNTVDGYATAGSNNDTFGPTTSNGYVYDSASVSDDVSYAYSSGWVNDSGPYRADASGSGTSFDATGHLVRSFEITNDLGFAADYSLEFFIYYGSLEASGTGVGYASYDLQISSAGNTLFASGAKITNDGVLTETGTQLDGATQNGSYYDWNGTYVTIGLGTLAAGESATIDYDLVSSVFGDYTECSGGDYIYGDFPIAALVIEGPASYCGNSAHLGDPFTLYAGAQPVVTATAVGQQQVPEPIGLGLVGLGLGALAWQRRRRMG